MLMDKLNKMEDCQAKADILLNVQMKMNEMKKHVDTILQKRLTSSSSSNNNNNVISITEYEKKNYQNDLEKYNAMKSKYEKLMQMKK